MKVALAFLVAVLGSTALVMYGVSWRHEPAAPAAASPGAPAEPEPASGSAQQPDDLASLFSEAVFGGEPEADEPTAPPASDLAQAAPTEVWYQYTDERGSVRFAQSLAEVPPHWRKRAGRVEMSVPIQTVSTPTRTRRPRAPRPASPEDQVWGGPRYTSEVIIYTTSWCSYCKKALEHLDERGVDYVEKDIEEDTDAEREYLDKSGGRRGVPLIDVGGQIMQGYSRQRLDQMLEKIS